MGLNPDPGRIKNFFPWKLRYSELIAQSFDREVRLLLDNASCRVKHIDAPIPFDVSSHYLTKKNTSVRQSLDKGVIRAIKKGCTRLQIGRVVDLIESGDTADICNLDLKLAIEWIHEIWVGLNDNMLRNVG